MRRNKKDEYTSKDVFICIRKMKIREFRNKDNKYQLGKWELWREY